MKTFKLVGMALLAIMMSFSLAACSDDDDDNAGGISASIVGEWQQTWAKGYEKYYEFPEDNDEWDEASDIYRIVFNNDGTGVQYADEGNTTYEYKFTWKLNGNTLYTEMSEGGYVETYESKVVQLTKDVLKLEEKDSDEEGSYYSLDTFKRTK